MESHRTFSSLLAFSAVLAAAHAAPAAADQVFADDVIVTGNLCAGSLCVSGETFGLEDFKIRDTDPDLVLEDTSAAGTSANTDWRFRPTDDAADDDYLGIGEDESAFVPSVKLYQGTPADTLVLRAGNWPSYGTVGIGIDPATTGVGEALQIADNYLPGIRLIQTVETPIGDAVPGDWRIFGSDTQFSISDATQASASVAGRFRIDQAFDNQGLGRIESPLVVGGDGRIGMGVATNEGETIEKQLHIRGEDPALGANNTTAIRVENLSPTSGNRRMFELVNNGSPLFVFTDTSKNRSWQMNPVGQDFVLALAGSGGQTLKMTGNGRLDLRDGANDPHFSVRPNGNVVIAGVLTQGSDVNSKTDIATVEGETVLAMLESLPIATWRYKTDEAKALHLGPMAQDFHAVFGLGDDDTRLAPGDMAGVALAGVKELNEKLAEKDAEIADLKAALAQMRERLDRMER